MMFYIKYFMSILMLCEIILSQIISLEPSIYNTITIVEKHNINSCPDREIVNLSGLGLHTVKNKFVKSQQIKALSFDYNDLNSVPSNVFDDVPNLECLNLAGNRISSKELEITHSNLRTLILDYQRLDEVEWSNCAELNTEKIALPNLENFSWRGVKAHCLYFPFSSFPNLNTIDLSETNLKYFSDNRSVANGVPNLKNVFLKGNNIDDFVSYDFENIETLYLDKNPLQNLYIEANRNKLELLSLSGCDLENIPTNIYSESLATLDLSHNAIMSISNDAFRYTRNIKNLDLSHNKLETFPLLENLYRLKSLSLSDNYINQIRHNITLPYLKMLSLRNNKMTYVSSTAFWNLEELEFLDLGDNELTSLPTTWHDRMRMLRYLNLEKNKFSTIHDMSIYKFSNIKELYMQGNYIKSIDVHALSEIPDQCVLHVL